ncbi:N-acetylmuramic acid 6-phosphate etherase [Salegentibacter salarius]|uniref:N-acetylmuramic acid 6-phosphate etherase n=1 Tax=Salegentibacter salarius TaxID=435906 RepID=A0A2N0TVK6_9FLAO|nr:N-acetylmuramic acid 6-phosphate etherase [Salegentibacter salarius]OEY72537.1 N-acetylmuramic acid 6-phosphate etherase [Salegentibacter salarius]PKD18773.1 N-acetylmuramic acid 6-phosphate etherase [Salegentibacter salarius]SLK02180.1 N-acetylmuramic acid 6-phosphate etherase [Salegentibacter salarius]
MENNNPDTEKTSKYNDLEKMSTSTLLHNINKEDKTVPESVEKELPAIEKLVDAIAPKMEAGGRLFYIGAGTSGRLGVLDASECPPTFGVSDELVIGLIAGGDIALRNAVENAEDDTNQAWKDLQKFEVSEKDVVVGIAASGTTPYVIGGIKDARSKGIVTGCVTCSSGSPLAAASEFPIEVVTGPEFVTGSTRMKAGTAQKLVLNMISTSVMIKLGRVKGNKMVDMQLSNKKLVGRGTRMIMEELNVDEAEAARLLETYKSVRNVLAKYES